MRNKQVVIQLILMFCLVFTIQAYTDLVIPQATDTSFDRNQLGDGDQIFQEDFQQKYKSKDFDYDDVKPTDSWFRKFWRWLFREKSDPISPGWTYFFKGLVILVFAYGLYVLANIIMGKKGNWFLYSRGDDQNLSYGLSESDLAETDFTTLIQQAIAQSDFRSAVRYHYLRVLHLLTQHKIIDFHKDKTNSDYSYEIKNTRLRSDFQYLSYIYDYTWYGAFDMQRAEYDIAHSAFSDLEKKIANG
ncbi:MAG: hypothetical protein WAU01_14910 [Saprospiraceae bacterium]